MNKINTENTENHPLLEVQGLWKEFRGPHGRLKILRDLHFKAHAGDMVFILGRSGSGKTTLLHLLGGFDKPTKGVIRFRGEDISKFNAKQMSGYRSKNLGFVFQFYHLLPELTLLENVMLPGIVARRPKRKEAERLLNRVGLSDRKEHYPGQLSGGEQQRAAIARALANNPEIILCDEPTGNLDEETAQSVFDLLVELNREDKKTFVIVTHEASMIKSERIIYKLHDGALEKNSG